jgi:hypothetical protein
MKLIELKTYLETTAAPNPKMSDMQSKIIWKKSVMRLKLFDQIPYSSSTIANPV